MSPRHTVTRTLLVATTCLGACLGGCGGGTAEAARDCWHASGVAAARACERAVEAGADLRPALLLAARRWREEGRLVPALVRYHEAELARAPEMRVAAGVAAAHEALRAEARGLLRTRDTALVELAVAPGTRAPVTIRSDRGSRLSCRATEGGGGRVCRGALRTGLVTVQAGGQRLQGELEAGTLRSWELTWIPRRRFSTAEWAGAGAIGAGALGGLVGYVVMYAGIVGNDDTLLIGGGATMAASAAVAGMGGMVFALAEPDIEQVPFLRETTPRMLFRPPDSARVTPWVSREAAGVSATMGW